MKLLALTLLLASLANFSFAGLLKTDARSLTEQQRMSNIDYLSMGYNIYKGNPLTTLLGVDPGFTFNKVFFFDYSTNQLSDDGRYQIPAGTYMGREDACNLDFDSTTITGSQSYSNSLKLSVSVEGGYAGAEFSASVDYQQVQEGSTSSNKIFTISSGECMVYRAGIDYYFPPQLNSNFKKAALDNLPEQYNATAYFRFLDTYGTHYLSEVHMGARLSIIDTLTEEGWKNLESRGVSVSAAAGYSGAFKAGIKTSVETQNTQTQEYNSKVVSTKTSSIGSKPPADGNLNTWAAALVEEPMPIKYSLVSISELLTARAFGVSDSATVQKLGNIKSNMERALSIGEYCANLRSRGLLKSCSVPPADKPLPTLIGSCRFCARSCGGLYPVDQGSMSQDTNWPNFFFDYPAGCDGKFAHNDMSGGNGVKLCCMKETDYQKGSCKLCTSCGNQFSYSSGGLLMDENWPNWITAFDNSCNSDARHRSHSGTGISLCCNQPKMCSFCSSCGGDYPFETGVVSADANWPNFFRGRGAQCGGGIGTVNYSEGMKMCCNSPGVQY